MLKVRDLRTSFIEYFKEKNHKIVHSSPLIPKDDPTLLFTTAGMVQFKPMFAGTVKLDYTRAATVQKCLRTSDLENVGRTRRHCTFFEMLGNFSFGDYFKEEAIEFAWNYSVNVLKFPKEKIWVSVYENDDEAMEIWNKKMGVPLERIVRLGKKDNFWGPAGDSGACGPCSELYIDKGEALGCGSPDCGPGCDCDRFMEYWNLVFNQFFQDVDGTQTLLPKTGIDTGMGLERLATICQNVSSIYETDELKHLVDFVCRELNIKYEGANVVPVNVIVEHSRALTFAMADGAYPSNEGRGYVLRRILRRALRFGRHIGIKEPFIYKMVDQVVEIMGDFYPEIVSASKNIKNVLEGEEKRFLETLENGIKRLEENIEEQKKSSKKQISGREAFILYDTYGFPVEMTEEMAREHGLSVNIEEFNSEMEKQRERGKQSWKAADVDFETTMAELSKVCGNTNFVGYFFHNAESTVAALSDGKGMAKTISAGDNGYIVLRETPFYAECGGQSGDRGVITSEDGSVFTVTDVKKVNKTFVHHGKVEKGSFKEGTKVKAEIDSVRRNLTAANHSATHLLQAALRSVLGEHVKQAGSLVEPERFRFDFSHFEAMKDEEIAKVEDIVNRKIWESIPVRIEEMPLEEALKSGAMAEFGEKYEDKVRVIAMGDFSMELCGGTHIDNTGKIGLFKIIKESSPGAGVRRIEGVTLKGLLDRYNAQNEIITKISEELDSPEKDLVAKVADLVKKEAELKKEIAKMKNDSLASGVDSIIEEGIDHNGVKLIVKGFDSLDGDALRNMADIIRGKVQNSALLLASSADGKVVLLAAATKVAVDRGADSGAVIKNVSKIVGGGGGGRKDMAQAGGKDASKINDALAEGLAILKDMIK